MRRSIVNKALVVGSLLAATWPAGSVALSEIPAAQMPDYEQTRTELWTLEQSIYAMRAKGSMGVIIDNKSAYMTGWPVISQALNSKAIKKPFTQIRGPGSLKGDKEHTELFFGDMAYDGHTAVMMYKTHKTMMSDGTPADDYFEVTHVWSKENGKWRLLSGRPQPVSPPEQ